MKITNLTCAIIGGQPTIRIATDAGIDGYGMAEAAKHYIKPHVLFYKELILGQDPRDVERVMQRIRKLGAFKPWGSAVSAIEMALWDIAGKAAGVPVYRLLGGKTRDRVRVYRTGGRTYRTGVAPEDYAAAVQAAIDEPGGFTIVKQGIGFHSPMPAEVEGFFYGDPRTGPPHPNGGLLTEHGRAHIVSCVEAMVETARGRAGIALDCGPGFTIPDVIRLARSLEHLPIMWMEDTLKGDYSPSTGASQFRQVTSATSIPIHTGEQIYLRENFTELIETNAVRIVGPDPLDVGGLAELKWVAEYAHLHGVLMAPHGILDGLIGLAGLVHSSAAMPENYIAFECPRASTDWWPDILDWVPDPLVVDGHIEVWDRPGLGMSLVPEKASAYLREEDADFFG